MTDGVAAFSSDWNFVYINRAAESFLGESREKLIGRNHWEMFPGTVGTLVEENYKRAADERTTLEFEYYYEPWRRWWSIKCFPADNGVLMNYFRDITAWKQSQQKLESRGLELEKTNRLLEEFAHVSSHDLQECVRSIRTWTQVLLTEIPANAFAAKESAEDIYRSVCSMEALIRELLVYSQSLHSNTSEESFADLAECYHSATAVLKQRIEECDACVAIVSNSVWCSRICCPIH